MVWFGAAALTMPAASGRQDATSPNPALPLPATPAPAAAPGPAPEPQEPPPNAPPSYGERVVDDGGAQPGDRVIVVFADGHRVEGEFVRSEPAHVVVRIANVESPMARSELSAVIVLPSPAKQFRDMRATIKDSDVERRIDLAMWARDRGMLEQAMGEVQGVLKFEPQNGDALRLLKEIEQLIMLRDKAAPKNTGDDGDSGFKPAAPRRPTLGEFPLLNAEQVNTLKVLEVDLKNPPRILITRETIDRLLTKYADHPLIPAGREARDAFRALPPEKILETMFAVRARDLYTEVQVTGNPASMEKFRDQVHSAWLVNNCATTRCHGGSAAGRLLLTNRRPNADASVYTNFLILDRFKTSDGRPLINWGEPEKSVLLQMGLPRDDALTPHPEVKHWSPVFRSREERRFLQAVEWMKMMYRPRPEYPVEYAAPGEAHDADRPAVPVER